MLKIFPDTTAYCPCRQFCRSDCKIDRPVFNFFLQALSPFLFHLKFSGPLISDRNEDVLKKLLHGYFDLFSLKQERTTF